jgi:hypothetical protein
MNRILYLLFISCLLWTGCNEDEENSIKGDPYAGGREPLTIKLLNEAPNPESAGPKERVTFRTSGLARYCHREEGRYDFEFFISDEQCRIENADDSTVTIIVPDAVSSGPTFLVLENQIFYGPYFKVLGSVTYDAGFSAIISNGNPNGANGVIYSCLPWCNNTPLTSEFYLFGGFSREAGVSDGTRWGGVAMINNETGSVGDRDQGNSDKFYTYRGIALAARLVMDGNAYAVISSEVRGGEYLKSDRASAQPQVLIYGSFAKYQSNSGTRPNIVSNNIALLNYRFELPVTNRAYYDTKGKSHSVELTTFQGGTDEAIVRAFSTSAGKIVAVGDFYNYRMMDYDNSSCTTAGTLMMEELLIPARSVLRMDLTGQLDYAYRRNPDDPERSLPGTTGTVRDAVMLNDESIILVGEMENFDGQAIHNIVKLTAGGQVDAGFLSRIGTGFDGIVRKINCMDNRILVTGNFTAFNGIPVQGVVMMDADGNIDPDFHLKEMGGGRPNFAKIVNLNANGDTPMPHVVMSGTFNRYDGVTRRGFLILDMKGDAIQRFNVPGEFYGELYDAHYSLTSDNANGLLLTGNFYAFDGKAVNNIVMLKVELTANETIND